MKTRDGHKIKKGGTYFLIINDSESCSPGSRIIKCICKKIERKVFYRHPIASMNHGTRIYQCSPEASLFNSLTKTKTQCLKNLNNLKEDFDTAFKNRVIAIKRIKE